MTTFKIESQNITYNRTLFKLVTDFIHLTTNQEGALSITFIVVGVEIGGSS